MTEDWSKYLQGEGRQVRCWWCGQDPLYVAYHDEEWGVPTTDDRALFEQLSLEGFQSGLSWLTILKKRENFRRAFRDFEFENLTRFTNRSVERLLQDAGIVRHRGKIEAVLNNAKRAVELVREHGSLAEYFWEYETGRDFPGLVSQTETSKSISKDLKKRGWKFVGPTTVYSFLQSSGIVNDHVPGCRARREVDKLRKAMT